MSANKVIVANAAALVTAVGNTATNDTTCISIESPNTEVLQLTSTLNIPSDFVGNASRTLIIEGNGITLQAGNNFGSDVPLVKRNNGFGVDIKTCSVVFRNVYFDCNNHPMTALEIFNSSNVILDNCKFKNCKTAVNMANVNRARISNCSVYNVTSVGFSDGVDASLVNPMISICNDITYTNCDVTSLAVNKSNIVGFSSYGTAGLSYYECSTLGRVGNCIKFDSAGGNASMIGVNAPNTVNNVQIRNFKAPMADSAMIYLYLTDGFVKIDGLYITSTGVPVAGGMVVIEANAYVMTNSPNPHLYVENLPYMPNNAIFKTTGGIPAPVTCPVTPPNDVVTWEFKEIYDGANIFSATRWYNGLIPYYRYAEFFGESKKILTDSISINNKFI